MPVRQLSLLANSEIQSDGTALSQRNEIKNFLMRYAHGLTRNEISRLLGYRINAVCGRINELIKEGLVEETDQRKDRFSGKLNYVLKVRI